MLARNVTLLLAITCLSLPGGAREEGRRRELGTITSIVIHTIGGPSCIAKAVQFRPIPVRADDASFWQRFMRSAPVADAHYVIGRGGSLLSIIPIDEIANHTVGVNPVSIGIELVHRGDGQEPFEKTQIDKLIDLVRLLRRQIPTIRIGNIVGHSDVDQRTCACGSVSYRRRQDPGANFPIARVLDGVRLPTDPKAASVSLPRLAGKSPVSECPIF